MATHEIANPFHMAHLSVFGIVKCHMAMFCMLMLNLFVLFHCCCFVACLLVDGSLGNSMFVDCVKCIIAIEHKTCAGGDRWTG